MVLYDGLTYYIILYGIIIIINEYVFITLLTATMIQFNIINNITNILLIIKIMVLLLVILNYHQFNIFISLYN